MTRNDQGQLANFGTLGGVPLQCRFSLARPEREFAQLLYCFPVLKQTRRFPKPDVPPWRAACRFVATGGDPNGTVRRQHCAAPNGTDRAAGEVESRAAGTSYFDRAFFTASLTSFPSTRAPPNLAITAFMTAPMSFMVGEPISATVAATVAAMSSALRALGM